jgi:peptide/nickel transport system permease protein
MGLPSFVARRVISAFAVLIGVTVITFFLLHLVAADPITVWLGKNGANNPSLVALYTRVYHLDAPFYVQYYYYLVGLLHGYLGFSTYMNVPVYNAIADTLPLTIQIVLLSMVFTFILGISNGLLSARFVGRTPDKTIRGFYIVFYSIPPFFVPLLLIIIFGYIFPILPTTGAMSSNISPPPVITGIPIFDAFLSGRWAAFEDIFIHMILPALANALVAYGIVTRVLRSSMIDTLSSNFIRAAKARGIKESKIFYRYAFKSSLIPVITILALITAFTFTSDAYVEYLFGYPGIGDFIIEAFYRFDYAGILGAVIVFAVVVVIANLIADILYAVVDPRIRYGAAA